MDLNEVLVFVKVVQCGSFSAAARLLGLPKSTVSLRVAGLERRLGVALLQRTTRQLHPTEAGASLFATCAKAIAEIEAGEAQATKEQGQPKGLLRVTAPVDVATSVLPDFLHGFLGKYPQVQLDLILTGRAADLVAEGIDVALRAGKLRDSSLIARKLGVSQFALFAAPAYLQRAPKILQPADLEKVSCLRFSKYSKGAWTLSSGRKELSVKAGSGVCADDLSALKELAISGHGVALLPIYLVRKDVEREKLRQVLPDWRSTTDDVFLLYPAQKFVQPKVKAFVSEAAEALRDVFSDRC